MDSDGQCRRKGGKMNKYKKLAEKAESQKPFARREIFESFPKKDRVVTVYLCPRCGISLSSFDCPNYCDNCGQALDWRDDQ